MNEETSIPFTPTHIAAVLPIAALRTRLSFLALAIGSMVPDFTVFFPSVVSYQATHSLFGVVVLCPLIGTCCYAVFRSLMHQPVVALLPDWVQARLDEPSPGMQPKEIPVIVASMCLGAATHVIWDSFTHADRWGTHAFSVLAEPAFAMSDVAVPWFKVLQYGSTLVFLPMMIALGLRSLARREPRSRYFSFSAGTKRVCMLIVLMLPFASWLWHRDEVSMYRRFGLTIKSSGASMLALTLVFSIPAVALRARADGRLVHDADA